MSIEDTKEKIAVMQAYVDGKTIQCRSPAISQQWERVESPVWNWCGVDYRVAPQKPREVWAVYDSIDKLVFYMQSETDAKEWAQKFGGTCANFVEVL